MNYEYDESEEYEEIEDKRKWNKVRERNIKINIAKQLINKGIVDESLCMNRGIHLLFQVWMRLFSHRLFRRGWCTSD